jgi:dihydropteroate synthase
MSQPPGRLLYAWTGLEPRLGASLRDLCQRLDLRAALSDSGERLYFSAWRGDLERLAKGSTPPASEALRARLDARPSHLRTRRGDLRYGPRPLVMGILNVTPDSFSDGGAYDDRGRAVARAWQMAEEGADLIDIGGESTRPGADPVPEPEELRRVLPVLEGLGANFPIPVSIDTHKPGVARQALGAGADLVNDVTGLRNGPEIARLVGESGAPLILSHIRGTPRTMQESPQYGDLMADVASDLLESARLAMREGAARDSLLIDPGIGFGKTLDHNLELIRRLPELAGLGFPLVIGVSRKSFIGRILDRPAASRVEGSLASAEAARLGGAAVVRVHDVGETARFFRMLGAIENWDRAEEETG